MKKHYLLLLIASIFLACNPNEPTNPGGGSSGGGTTPGGGTATTPTADFAYTPTNPFTFQFTNLSSGASSYKWDFGDGETSKAKEPEHTFAQTGMYDVTLTATSSSGVKATKTKKIQVTEPTVYLTGFKLASIPAENQYYRIRLNDDYILSPDWKFYSPYTPALTLADMDYTMIFDQPVEMSRLDKDTYYEVYVYRNTTNSNTNNDKQCLKDKLYVSHMKTSYASQYLFVSSDGETILWLMFSYK